MVIRQAEIWWADLPEPTGSEPGFRPLQIITIDRGQLIEQAGRISKAQLDDVLAGLDVVLGR